MELESLIHNMYDVYNLHVGAHCLDIFTPCTCSIHAGGGQGKLCHISITVIQFLIEYRYYYKYLSTIYYLKDECFAMTANDK